MHGYESHQPQRIATMSRIDLILTLYDGVLERLERVGRLLDSQPSEAKQVLNQCQVVIAGMAAGINPEAGDVAANLQRLHEFAAHCLAQGSSSEVRHALEILKTLRDGYEAVRSQALDMERTGQIPPLGETTSIQALA